MQTLMLTHFSLGQVNIMTPGLSGLVAGVAEIGATLNALLNGQPASGPVIWLVDGVAVPGETSTSFVVPAAEGGQISLEIDGQPSAPAPIRYSAPVITGALADQTLDRNTGMATLDGASAFSFGGTLAYSLMGAPTGVSVDQATGLVSIDTDLASAQSGTAITLRGADATDNGRFAETSFLLTVTASVPEGFAPASWSVADAETGGDVLITLLALPGNGGSPIQIVQYSLDGGAWTPISGANATGVYTLNDLFTDGVATDVQIRAVNQSGPGPASDVKSVTTSNAAAALWAFSGSTVTQIPQTAGWNFTGSTVTAIGDV